MGQMLVNVLKSSYSGLAPPVEPAAPPRPVAVVPFVAPAAEDAAAEVAPVTSVYMPSLVPAFSFQCAAQSPPLCTLHPFGTCPQLPAWRGRDPVTLLPNCFTAKERHPDCGMANANARGEEWAKARCK